MNPIIIFNPNVPARPNQPITIVRPINPNQPYSLSQAMQSNQPVAPYIIILGNPSANIQGQNANQFCPRLWR